MSDQAPADRASLDELLGHLSDLVELAEHNDYPAVAGLLNAARAQIYADRSRYELKLRELFPRTIATATLREAAARAQKTRDPGDSNG